MTDDDDGLKAAIERAQEIAGVSLDPFDHRRLRALEAIAHADHPPPPFDPAQLAGLPPWSEISSPGEPQNRRGARHRRLSLGGSGQLVSS